MEEIAGIENLEKEFVAFLAIFAHKRGQILHGRSLYLLKAIERIDILYSIEYVVALRHFHWSEIASALGILGFCAIILL